MRPETKVGLFTVIGIVLFGITIYMLGNISMGGEYKITVRFNDVSGLPKKSVVKLNGVEVGKVRDIKMSGDHVAAVLGIKEGVGVFRDSVFKIASTSLIGTKYLAIVQGNPSSGILKDGDIVDGSQEPPLEEMLAQTMSTVQDLAKSVNGNGELGRNLNETMLNLRMLSNNLNSLIASMKPYLENTMTNVSRSTDDLQALMARADDITRQIQDSEGVLGALINDPQMKKDIKESVSNLNATMGEAKEFIGKMSRFRVFWLYDGYYNTASGVMSNNVGLKIYPSNDYMYYRVGASNLGNTKNFQGTNDYIERNEIDARLGFYNRYLDISAGYIMGAGGVAAVVTPFADSQFLKRLSLQGQATDFGRDRYINGRHFNHANIWYGANFEINKYLNVGAGMTDALEVNQPYIKATVKFQDKDIAAFFGLATLAK
ncbi:MAG: MlaD family protein [Elusimicrobium sp.]|jgi:phospholipid/cholesterol/gamma-HCH transport system substrate-binding protein|nr:MlaD family protein [Elusimicrobium sp.]